MSTLNEQITSISNQLDQILRQRILDGTYAIDSRLPAEEVLAKELGVSRPTLRTALTKLESEGWISRKQGHGTFVNKHVISVDAKPKEYWNFISLINASGRAASTQCLSFEKRVPTQQELDLRPDLPKEKYFVLNHLYLANEQAVIHSTGFVPAKFFVEKRDQYDFNMPIDALLKEYCHQEISYSVSDIRPTFTPPHVAQHLKLQSNIPVLLFIDTFYNLQNQALLYGISYYADQFLRIRVAHSWG